MSWGNETATVKQCLTVRREESSGQHQYPDEDSVVRKIRITAIGGYPTHIEMGSTCGVTWG